MSGEQINAAASTGTVVTTGLNKHRGFAATGHWEATVQAQFLPRCAECLAPHPLSRTPPLPAAACPNCGAALAPLPDVVEVPSATSFELRYPRAASWLLSTGAWLRNLADRM